MDAMGSTVPIMSLITQEEQVLYINDSEWQLRDITLARLGCYFVG